MDTTNTKESDAQSSDNGSGRPPFPAKQLTRKARKLTADEAAQERNELFEALDKMDSELSNTDQRE